MEKETTWKTESRKKSVKELCLPAAYDPKLRAYILADGSYMDLIKINAKDLINSDPDEVEFDCLKLTKFYKTYVDDLKLLALNFPCDLHEQLQYANHLINRTKNQVHKDWLMVQKMELEYLQKNNTSREYYFMLFADTAQKLEQNRQQAAAILGEGLGGLMSYMEDKKKHQILFKLNNKNASITVA